MTIKFKNIFINNYYSVLGRNEHEVTITADEEIKDYYLNEKAIELAESAFQLKSIKGLLLKSKLKEKNINLLIGSDLQPELMASNFAAKDLKIPFLGIYSACASFASSLIISASVLKEEKLENIIVTTSAHNLASEKTFRFPIEYGCIRKYISTFTSTGSVSALVSNKEGKIKIESGTLGTVNDIGFKDVNNMGAAMAHSAAKTIYEHLKDTKRKANYYDLILTGDLGIYGVKILKEYMKKEYKIDLNNLKDAGTIFYKDSGKSIAGASGPVTLPLVLFNDIINQKYKKILIVATGSLHTRVSSNLKMSIPSIAHAVSLEVL